MKSRGLFVVGIVFFALGSIVLLYTAYRVWTAYINGVFAFGVSDYPNQSFENLQCPHFLQINKTAYVTATIRNPIDETLYYTVTIETHDSIDVRTDRKVFSVLPGHQSTKISWLIAPTQQGDLPMAFMAMSNKDRDLPGPFHFWPTSYRESCGIAVIPGPFSGQEILWLSLINTLIGLACLVMQFTKKTL